MPAGRQRTFLLSVSHELRTPLTAIEGFAEALADGVTTGADVPAAGAVVLAEAQRLERLVRDLLDLARLGAHDFHIDLAPVDRRPGSGGLRRVAPPGRHRPGRATHRRAHRAGGGAAFTIRLPL